jgi:TRAP-type mannitol/chloroaromatic compound transport system permease small subunit
LKKIKKVIFNIEKLNKKIGEAVSWLVLSMALTAFFVVLLRYFYNIGFVWMQESYIWMHGLIFLFGASYALMNDKHVRVDIFYRLTSEKIKALINIIFSILFLIPFIIVISKYSIPYILKSWDGLEKSREAGGIPFLYLYKSCLLLFCINLFFQTISLILRCLLVLSNKEKKIFFKLIN